MDQGVTTEPPFCAAPYTRAFIGLWNSVYAKRGLGWEDNPWVWVVSFKVI